MTLLKDQVRTNFNNSDPVSWEELENGSLRVPITTNLIGVLNYIDKKTGKVVKELKHPDDVFAARSVNSLNNLIITDDHPPEGLITTKNASKYQRGLTDSHSKIRECIGLDNFGTITVFDLIEKMRAGKIFLSPGYLCDIIKESGIWVDFEGREWPYDQRQVNIRLNHLAVIFNPREGEQSTIRLNEGEIINYIEKGVKTVEIQLNGVTYDIPDPVANTMRNNTATIIDYKNQITEKEKALGATTARLNMVEEDLKQAKSIDLDAMVSERLEFQTKLNSLNEVLKLEGKDEIKLNGLTPLEAKTQMLNAFYPTLKFENQNEVNGGFKSLEGKISESRNNSLPTAGYQKTITIAGKTTEAERNQTRLDAGEEARIKMIEKQAARNKA